MNMRQINESERLVESQSTFKSRQN